MGPIPKELSLVLLVGCFVTAIAAAGELEGGKGTEILCEGPYKNLHVEAEELATVLRNHQAWLQAVAQKQKQKIMESWRPVWAALSRWELWLEAERELNDMRRANLCRAILIKEDLQGAKLGRANLQGARLSEVNLQGASLAGADLQNVSMVDTNLQGANLYKANLQDAEVSGRVGPVGTMRLERFNLQNADLRGADLQGAFLAMANLQGADLRGANLQNTNLPLATLEGADLTAANLQNANLSEAKLTRVIYEPNLESLPRISSLIDTRLEEMVFHTSPAALLTLREAFKKAGMRTQERQLTYAVKHTERLQAWDPSIKRIWRPPDPLELAFMGEEAKTQYLKDNRPWLERVVGKSESLFNYMLFEIPSGYGMAPSHALATLGLLILGFSLVYMVALVAARGRAGIWVTWPTDRVYQEEGAKDAMRVTTTFFFPRVQARAAGHWWGVLLRGVSVPLIGLYFSLLSAFSVGWRELNVGTWIARVQPREYVLRATGWVRTVTGIQSLLSVYLLALWVLTYFGRPFE